MNEYNLIRNNIARSQRAYNLYKKIPNYHHALHIFNANKIVYDELNNLLASESINVDFKEGIIDYLFHLEDWFLQFSLHEKKIDNPEDEFIFSSFKYSITFPTEFIGYLQ